MTCRIRTAEHDGEEIKATFTQTFTLEDGEWVGDEDYDILSLDILGVTVSPLDIPENLTQAIIDLAREIEEWEYE